MQKSATAINIFHNLYYGAFTARTAENSLPYSGKSPRDGLLAFCAKLSALLRFLLNPRFLRRQTHFSKNATLPVFRAIQTRKSQGAFAPLLKAHGAFSTACYGSTFKIILVGYHVSCSSTSCCTLA